MRMLTEKTGGSKQFTMAERYKLWIAIIMQTVLATKKLASCPCHTVETLLCERYRLNFVHKKHHVKPEQTQPD